MRRLVEDEELRCLRAMSDGSKPFTVSGLWERRAALDLKEFMKLPPRERLAVSYYVAGRRCAEALQEVA